MRNSLWNLSTTKKRSQLKISFVTESTLLLSELFQKKRTFSVLAFVVSKNLLYFLSPHFVYQDGFSKSKLEWSQRLSNGLIIILYNNFLRFLSIKDQSLLHSYYPNPATLFSRLSPFMPVKSNADCICCRNNTSLTCS